MFKKIFSLLLLIALVLSLFSCNKNNQSEDNIEEDLITYNEDQFTDIDKENLEGEYHLAKNIQDGVILHAWNWSYNEIKDNLETIARAGFSTIQTSPVQQPKDYNPNLKQVGSLWWKLYQPLAFAIGNESWLGTKAELQELCEEANKYKIKIIVDIVANHLAGGSDVEFNPNVESYEPEIYNNNLLHADYKSKTDNIADEVYAPLGGYPDLQTENQIVQERVLSLLKECIDVGVKGFRFDAAKHIATSTDGAYKSEFWNYILNGATEYANSTYNFTPYYYGEILGGLANGRNMETYTSMMSVTDDTASGQIFNKLNNTMSTWQDDITRAVSKYYKSDDPSKIVLWVESHDTYAVETTHGQNTKINKVWSIIANRKGATALFFARPNYDNSTKTYVSEMGEMGSDNFLEKAVIQANKFHNLFIGADEIIHTGSKCVAIERYRKEDNKRGVIITNVAGRNEQDIEDIEVGLKDGIYYDQVNGNEFKVINGKLSGHMIGGLAIIYEAKSFDMERIPFISVSLSSTKFFETQDIKIDITVSSTNTTKIQYKIDNGEFKDLASKKITVDEECTVTFKYKNDTIEREKTVKIENIEYVAKKDGYIAVAGVSQDVIDNYEIFAWTWGKGSTYKEVLIENGVVYIPYNNETGMLLVVYEKGTKLSDFKKGINEWDSELVTQTEDFIPLNPNTCYDAKLS